MRGNPSLRFLDSASDLSPDASRNAALARHAEVGCDRSDCTHQSLSLAWSTLWKLPSLLPFTLILRPVNPDPAILVTSHALAQYVPLWLLFLQTVQLILQASHPLPASLPAVLPLKFFHVPPFIRLLPCVSSGQSLL